MYKLVFILVLFSAVLFSCKKEVITLEDNTNSTEVYKSKSPLTSNGTNGVGTENPGDDSDAITDPNNDADEDKRKKGR